MGAAVCRCLSSSRFVYAASRDSRRASEEEKKKGLTPPRPPQSHLPLTLHPPHPPHRDTFGQLLIRSAVFGLPRGHLSQGHDCCSSRTIFCVLFFFNPPLLYTSAPLPPPLSTSLPPTFVCFFFFWFLLCIVLVTKRWSVALPSSGS